MDQIASNQPRYSILETYIEKEVLPLCEDAKASARSSSRPLRQGVLTGKYRPGQPPPAGSRAATPARRRSSSAAFHAGRHAACRRPSAPDR